MTALNRTSPHGYKIRLIIAVIGFTVAHMTEGELAPATTAPVAKQATRAGSHTSTMTMIRARKAELDKRLPIYQAVEDAYDREPTDSREALEIDGLGWTCTIDWGGMKAGVDQGALVDYNLATQPETYVSLIPKRGGQGVNDRLKVIETEDKKLLDSWTGWHSELEMMLHNRRAHGLGVFHFPHPVGWHFRSVHPSALIYPKEAKINCDEWDWFALVTEFKITDLLRRLEEPKIATAIGWNISNVRKAISKLKDGAEFLHGMYANPEHYAVNLRGSDIAFADKNKGSIPGYAFYVKEWDGRVSEHFVIDSEDIGYLFSGIGRHESMSSTIALFPLAMGQGFMERVRGYGVEMLPYHDTENRARNHVLDQHLVSGVVLKSLNGDDGQRAMMDMKHHGPFLFMSGDLEIAAEQMPDMSEKGLKLLAEMERSRAINNQSLGGVDHSQRNSDMSATQSRILHQDGNSAAQNEVVRFYKQLERFHKIRIRRTYQLNISETHPGGKEALSAVEDMIASGVVLADFQNIKEVKARSIFGDGNATNQWLAMMDIEKLFGFFTADGKAAYVQDAVAARLRDPERALRYTGADGRIDQLGQLNRWAAQMENNVFETSDTRQDLGPKDDHVIHLDLHTTYAEEMQKREEVPLAEQFKRVHRAQAHCALHLDQLRHDVLSAGAFKSFNQRWANLTNWLRQTGQKLEAEQQKQQEAQMEEMRNPRPKVKDAEVMLTEKLRRDLELQKAEAEERRAEEKHIAEMRRIAERNAMGGKN